MKNFSKISFLVILAILLYFGCKKDQSKGTTGTLPIQTVTTATIPDGMVMTPQGLMAKANVHLIENGYHLEVRGSHVMKIKTTTGKIQEDFGAVKIEAPKPTSNPGATITSTNSIAPKNGIDRSLGAVGTSGWMTYSQYHQTSGAPIANFVNNWIVPNAPTGAHGQVIYIGNAVASGPYSVSSPPIIMESVLQWGANGLIGYNNCWIASNWCTWSGGAAYSPPTAQNALVAGSTSVTGNITYTGQTVSNGSTTYTYTVQFNNITNAPLYVAMGNPSIQTGVTMPLIQLEPYAYEVLEAYNSNGTSILSSVNDYPNQPFVRMSNVTIITGTNGNFIYPTLSYVTPSTPNALFGEHTFIQNPSNGSSNQTSVGEVDLWFHYSPPCITIAPGSGPSGAYQTCFGTPITTAVPVNGCGGGITFSFSPSTPAAGLTYNSNGTVSTSATTPAGTYSPITITATNNGGSSSGTVNIVVVGLPVISYTTPDVYTVGGTYPNLVPNVTGAAVTSYSISPATLPAGISFNTSTGVFVVAPTAASPSTNYTVTAHSTCSNATTVVNITVNVATGLSQSFNINSSNPSYNGIYLFIDGNNVSGSRGISQSNPINITASPVTPNLHATVVLQIGFGPIPTSATLYGPFAPINGVISGSNITFSNVNLSVPQTLTLNLY